MPPRNVCVARGSLMHATFPVVYTVPSGNVFLLKSVETAQQSGTAFTVQFAVRDPVGGTQVFPVSITAVAGASGHWSGWLVLNAGDTIIGVSQTDNVEYWISGAVLPFA